MLKRRVQYCESCWKEGFNFLRHIKKIQILDITFKEKRFNSLRHIQRKKGSILCVIFEKSSILGDMKKKNKKFSIL